MQCIVTVNKQCIWYVCYRPELISKLLESLGQQIFQPDLIRGSSSEIPPESQARTLSEPPTGSSLLRVRRLLSEKSAEALRSLCVNGQDLVIIQALAPNLLGGRSLTTLK